MLKQKLGNAVFKITGWTYHIEDNSIGPQQVIIGFEHTSNMDFILSLALFQVLDLKISTMVKHQLFKGPLKPILTKLGAIPVNRDASTNVVDQMVERFKENDQFNLVIAPEATRAKDGEPRHPIRTGFWHIAKAAKVPIVLMYANAKTKRGGIIGKINPTHLDDDLKSIKLAYEQVGIHVIIPEPKSSTT